MNVIRFILRFIVFMIGLTAIVLILGVGAIVLRNKAAGTGITVAKTEGEPSSVARAPQDAEDWAIYVMLQARADEINTPLSDDPAEVSFTVEPGESALAVAQKLAEMGLIGDAQLFRRFLSYNKLDLSLEAGDYTLRKNMNMLELLIFC